MNLKQKIQEARVYVSALGIKPGGHNDYSDYDFYTPEQVDSIGLSVCSKFNLYTSFSLVRDAIGIHGILKVYDLDEDNSYERFDMAIEIPKLTASNAAQQHGGAMTYCKRYLLCNAFGISDNSSDFDSIRNEEVKMDEKAIEIGSELYTEVLSKLIEDPSKFDACVKYYKANSSVWTQMRKDMKKGGKGGAKKH